MKTIKYLTWIPLIGLIFLIKRVNKASSEEELADLAPIAIQNGFYQGLMISIMLILILKYII
jgi:hypothetical protein